MAQHKYESNLYRTSSSHITFQSYRLKNIHIILLTENAIVTVNSLHNPKTELIIKLWVTSTWLVGNPPTKIKNYNCPYLCMCSKVNPKRKKKKERNNQQINASITRSIPVNVVDTHCYKRQYCPKQVIHVNNTSHSSSNPVLMPKSIFIQAGASLQVLIDTDYVRSPLFFIRRPDQFANIDF